VRFYREQLGAFLRYLEEQQHSLELEDIIPFEIIGCLEALKARGVSPATVRSRLPGTLRFLRLVPVLGVAAAQSHGQGQGPQAAQGP